MVCKLKTPLYREGVFRIYSPPLRWHCPKVKGLHQGTESII
nr:MAG TPA: hypothetical protein [Caudoviricetes sp.]